MCGLVIRMARRGATGPFEWLRGFWTRASLVLLILISVGLLVSGRNSERETAFSGIRKIGDDVASPVMWVVNQPGNGFRYITHWIGSYWNAGKRVRELEAENKTLRQWEALSHALHSKILRYEQLLAMQGEAEVRVISTRIIAEAQGPFARSALLRAGRGDGVVKGQAVVDPDGLVGRIISVGNRSARVLLLNDLNSRIPVMFEGTLARAILAGDNSSDPKLIYTAREFIPKIGTRISTSGDDGVLPAGISVGEVVAVEEQGGVRELRVRMYANLSAIDFVQILAVQPIMPPEDETTSTSDTGESP
ncbi:Rod shape-determining protein MreC [hydrothermal vent metagenome]|uniref:Cell shape-determining protein MreC n=1 Tax=hydrothermal vent metagenome TaxID=652676 RepID=A0A3B0RWW6_9ZZZZ